MKKTRREFLTTAALTLSALQAKKLFAINHDLLKIKTALPGGPPTAGVALAVSTTRTVTIPKNFVGLSYESHQLVDPHFFSPANRSLVAQFKTLAPAGVLRLGGQTSEYSWWQSTPSAPEPIRPARYEFRGSPEGALSYPISAAAIDNLAKFLHATGWTCIYGLNLGNGSPELDIAEAVYVANALGTHLEYFQIGNAIDLFPQNFRNPTTWSPQTYFNEWLALARAITEKVPTARFGGPDVATHPEWFSAFAAILEKTPNPPKVVAISHHHFAGGPPASPQMTIPNLLSGANERETIAAVASRGTAIAKEIHAGLRMVEGNSCFAGGKPGVSDVFASSLWAADYLLHLASLGYAGANLHGGDVQSIVDSIGNALPGESLSPKPSEPRPFYTPIAHTKDSYVAEPVFYGMLFAQQFAGATMLDVAFDPTFTPVNVPAVPPPAPSADDPIGAPPAPVKRYVPKARVNANAYAAIRPDGKTIIAVINKDLTNDLVLHLTGVAPSSILNLTAPAPDSANVTFAGATANGDWTPHPGSAVIYFGHNAPIHVPKASAVLLVSH